VVSGAGFGVGIGVVEGGCGGRRLGAGEEGDRLGNDFGADFGAGTFGFCGAMRPCVFIDTGGANFVRPILDADPHLSSLKFVNDFWERCNLSFDCCS